MKRSDTIKLVLVALFTAGISLVVSGALFSSPAKRNATVPVVQTIKSSYPDITHESDFNSFLNPNALDPTQTVQVGNTKNNAPFSNQ